MTFSQAWDAGFKSLLIFFGTVFLWLMIIEDRFPDRSLSVIVMTVVAAVLALGFFFRLRTRCVAERRAADAEVAQLLAEDA